jgi:hypothetical protein
MTGAACYVLTSAASLAAFGAGWLTGRLLGRKGRRLALVAAGGALFLVCSKALLHRMPAWEAALFPWTGYAYLQGYWLWPAALLFFGLAVPQLPLRWNRIVVAGAVACVFASSLWSSRWMILPPEGSPETRADGRNHCAQSTSYTCVPASCVSLLSRWGIEATEQEMAALCLTRSSGTTTYNAYRGLLLRLRGEPFEVHVVEAEASALRRLGVPAIVGEAVHHAVVVRFEGERAVLDDPLLRVPILLMPDELGDYLRGSAVVVLPAEGAAAAP